MKKQLEEPTEEQVNLQESLPAPLDAAEERYYFERYKYEGDMEARSIIIHRNQRLAMRIAVNMGVPPYGLRDALQCGVLGIVAAVEKFDLKKNLKFSTYSTWWIRRYISREYFGKNTDKRVPVYIQGTLNRLLKAASLGNIDINHITDEMIIMAHKGSPNQNTMAGIRNALLGASLSLDYIKDDGEETFYNSFGAFDEEVEAINGDDGFADILKKAIEMLSKKERAVIRLHYFEDVPIPDVAKLMDVSHSRANQLRKNALNKLKKKLKTH